MGVEAIAAIGITNQRETTIVWDRKPARRHKAIVWQDQRTADLCTALRELGTVQQGLLPILFSAKIAWILIKAGLHARYEAGELAFGTIECSPGGSAAAKPM